MNDKMFVVVLYFDSAVCCATKCSGIVSNTFLDFHLPRYPKTFDAKLFAPPHKKWIAVSLGPFALKPSTVHFLNRRSFVRDFWSVTIHWYSAACGLPYEGEINNPQADHAQGKSELKGLRQLHPEKIALTVKTSQSGERFKSLLLNRISLILPAALKTLIARAFFKIGVSANSAMLHPLFGIDILPSAC